MIYRLDNFEIDPANFVITKDGHPVSVEPLVFDLIVHLVENRHRVLTRQELFDEIWAGKVVSDTSLSNHVKSARKALGDDGQKQEIIRTVHGRGYRFVAHVEEAGSLDVPGKNAAVEHRTVDRRARGLLQKRLIAYAVLVVLLAAVGSRFLFFAPDVAIRSIAVLPLNNLSDDPDQKYFVEGMQDALITRLSTLTGLRVISKTSTLRYETSSKSMPEIARELNVDALVEGSVLRDGNRVRISAQLIRGSQDEQIWAGSYDRDLDHVLILINDISLAIADEIKVAVKQQPAEDWANRRLASLQVHELVLKGHHYLDRFMLDRSLDYFEQAVALDPEFAPAHAGVAGSHFLIGFLQWTPGSEHIPMAREAALKAISLDDSSAEAFSCLGVIQLYFDWDWASAEKSLLKALDLRANDALTRHAYADYLMVMGDVDGSLEQMEIGHLYDPLSPLTDVTLTFHRILARQYKKVIDEGRIAIARNPERIVSLSYFHEALWLEGMHDEAFAAFKSRWGRDPELLQAVERGYAASGYAGAMHDLAETLAGRDAGSHNYVMIAGLYVRAGETEEALAWLEKAFEYRQPQILHINAMPAFDELHSMPQFKDLLRRIGFPETALRDVD